MSYFQLPWAVLSLSTALIAVPLLLWTKRLGRVSPLPEPSGGRRAEMRERAFCAGYSPSVDRYLRYGGAGVRRVLQGARQGRGFVRARILQLFTLQERQLMFAGYPVGWSVEELWALSLTLSAVGAVFGWWAGVASGTWVWIFPSACLLGSLPMVRLQSRIGDRFSEVSRELPAVIDLTALAMGAGLDFPGALKRVTEGQEGVVAEELRQVLLSLELGITRHSALMDLRQRVPVAEVKDLVRAVVMAERKGSSVTDALSQQAQTSRQRRSVRAEEAAARAGVLLLVPVMLLLGCVMILLVGPMLASGLGL